MIFFKSLTLGFFLLASFSGFSHPTCENGSMRDLPIVDLLKFVNTKSEFQFSVKGPDLGKLHEFRNCLDYNFCHFISDSLAGEEGNYRLHLFIELNPEELSSVLSTCVVPNNSIKISIKNTATSTAVTAPSDLPVTPSVELNPSQLPEISQERYDELNMKTDSLIKEKKVDEAIQLIMTEFSIPSFDYEIKFSSEVGSEYSVTDHDTKKIMIGKNFITNLCSLMRAVRHELEHAKQVKRHIECKGRSAMGDHRVRERAAYLNDMRNASVFCKDNEMAKNIQQNSVDNFLRYKN